MKYTIEAIRKPNTFLCKIGRTVENYKFTQDETKIKWTTEKTAKNNIRVLESKYPDSFRLVAAKEIFGSDWSSILSSDNDNKEITLTSLTDEL